jgi:DNA-binding beta-propeller fold protein YncE
MWMTQRRMVPWAVCSIWLFWGCSRTLEPEALVDVEQTRLGLTTGDVSGFVSFRAPAGARPTALSAIVEGRAGAILPNGRLVTPAGIEVNVGAPKPFGLALSPDGKTAATINSGASGFSVTLIRQVDTPTPVATRVDLDSTFMGIAFSPDGSRFYAAGGEIGNVWVGDVRSGHVIGSVNLNGPTHPLGSPLAPATGPSVRFKGAFSGNLVLTRDGRFLYVVDQGSFSAHAIDTSLIVTGVDAAGAVMEPDNFGAIVGRTKVGRYPFGIGISPDQRTLLVTNVGVFQYSHLRPSAPVGDSNQDYPLCIPGVGYPDDVETATTIRIKKIDASTISGLPTTLRDPDGIRCGYVPADITYTIPALGSPNAPESSSVYVLDLALPAQPVLRTIIKTGRAVGSMDDGVRVYAGSHPNAVAVGGGHTYVSNGSNDTIAVLDRAAARVVDEISLAVLPGADRRLKGVEPVSLALSPDHRFLYVAEAGLNAVGVIALGPQRRVVGHIPTGWWPSSVKVSEDGTRLVVTSAKGRGAGPTLDDRSPKHSVLGTLNVVTLTGDAHQLGAWTEQVMRNNGFAENDRGRHGSHARDGAEKESRRGPHGRTEDDADDNPIPAQAGVASSRIKHVIFVNKENATHDLVLGDITSTRRGAPVDGDPAFSLGPVATPNHHELALRYTFGDNFFLEPTVSSDGHRWLTNTYTTELEEVHWPASYGGRKRDSGDDPEVIANYPGRIGFTDANSSPEPNDLNEHGGIYAHLLRNGRDFVNFGNGFEFALVDEDGRTEPTGIREHANVPMEKIVRDRTDHLFPEYNTHIPDAPLPEEPDRFNRFGRFKQVFEAHYVDRAADACKLPSYVDLYYPNDHGGGANDIHPGGPSWDYTRFVQDNDAALGLTVELISHSPCWKDTVIFVVEDDTQNGLDHVDGYRSIFLAISPWVKREHVTKQHISLASIFKTVDLIFGMPPLNQYDAAATDLRDIFTGRPDFRGYEFVQPTYVAQAKSSWKRLTRHIDFSHADRDEVALRRAIQKSEGLPRRHAARRARTVTVLPPQPASRTSSPPAIAYASGRRPRLHR